MIKDNKFVCTDFPQYNIKYGMLPGSDELKIKEWLKENVINLCVNVNINPSNLKDTKLYHSVVDAFVKDVYDYIHQVGYDEGYDSAQSEGE